MCKTKRMDLMRRVCVVKNIHIDHILTVCKRELLSTHLILYKYPICLVSYSKIINICI